MNVNYSRGYQSMGILHYIGLKDKHKGLFEGMILNDAIKELKQSNVSNFNLVIGSLERTMKMVINEIYKDNETTDDIDEGKEYPEGKEEYIDIENEIKGC